MALEIIKVKGRVSTTNGIHASQAQRIVNNLQTLGSNSEFLLDYNGRLVDVKSILGLLALAIEQDSELIIHAKLEKEFMADFLHFVNTFLTDVVFETKTVGE